ncbi:hypothetical protein [Porphyromonas sp.]|uniref:hypothetical protein n=1 Tax=Porphyromonas sp. TaxID=1924944 RepID=UPI0026DC1E00|nr:hypothetical protein [Porphyromonas sp.]MDO4771112.1 hypothetical protein [Porphyromonas sp.]
MKRLFLSLVAVLLTLSAAHAQGVFSQGRSTINIGGAFFGELDKGRTIKTPHLSVAYDLSVVDKLFGEYGSLGVGAYIANVGYKSDAMGNFGFTTVGARGTLHFEFVKNLDLYIGGMAGYAIRSSGKDEMLDTLNIKSQFAWTGFGGIRYMFTNFLGIYAEGGYGAYMLNGGLTLRF